MLYSAILVLMQYFSGCWTQELQNCLEILDNCAICINSSSIYKECIDNAANKNEGLAKKSIPLCFTCKNQSNMTVLCKESVNARLLCTTDTLNGSVKILEKEYCLNFMDPAGNQSMYYSRIHFF